MKATPGIPVTAADKSAPQTAAQRIAARRKERRSHFPRWQVVLVRALIVLLLLVAAGAWSLLAVNHHFASRVYLNVSVQGVALGQMNRSEAETAVRAGMEEFVRTPVTLSYGDTALTPTLAELGGSLDIDAAVERALSVGHEVRPVDSLRSMAAIWQEGIEVPLHLEIDHAAMQAYLVAHLPELEHPAVDASLRLDGTDIIVTEAVPGRQVLVDATLRDMTAAVQSLKPQAIKVRTRPLAPVLNDQAVAEAQQAIETLLQAPVTLIANEQTWAWAPADIAGLIEIERTAAPQTEGDQLLVSLDREQIKEHLQWFAVQTRVYGDYPRVDWDNGNLTIFRAGVPGSRINVEQATDQVLNTLWTPERTLTLPFEAVPVPTTSAELANLGINEVISVGRTSFEDSEDYRVTNIVAGMRLLHGVMVAPGEEFSFNQTIQSIGPENGFVEGYAIVDEETQLEWGGGICQDSTTLFRAAFWAGVPITERWNHSRYISWYDEYGYGEYGNGPGLDSTIFLGGPDLRFYNDTGNWILIQAYADPASEIATIVFYGTRGGRTVEFAGPNIEYLPKGGMDVSFTRIIKQDGVEERRVTYWSTYKPW